MIPFEQAWAEVPGWRKAVGFLLFLTLWATDRQITDFMLGKDWEQRYR